MIMERGRTCDQRFRVSLDYIGHLLLLLLFVVVVMVVLHFAVNM